MFEAFVVAKTERPKRVAADAKAATFFIEKSKLYSERRGGDRLRREDAPLRYRAIV